MSLPGIAPFVLPYIEEVRIMYVSVFSINLNCQLVHEITITRNTQAITGDLYKDDAIHENLKVSTVLIINCRQFT